MTGRAGDPTLGAVVERFVATASWFRAEAALRFVSAALALGAAALALLGSLPLAAFFVVLTGALVGIAWIGVARRSWKRADAPSAFTLTAYEKALTLGEGEGQTVLPYGEITSIAVDEDRLDVVIEHTKGPPVRIEPRYPGVEIHELVSRLRNVWSRQRDC